MRTEVINIYKFAELSEEAKQKAIENLSDINVDYEWWDSVYEDAKNIGLKITGFDIDRGSYCKGEFNLSALEVAQNILNKHGETCETYKTASNFLAEHQPIFSEYLDETSENYESQEFEDKLTYLEDDFLKSLCEDYRIMLDHEYEYLASKEAIIEAIEANDYEFTVNGNLR